MNRSGFPVLIFDSFCSPLPELDRETSSVPVLSSSCVVGDVLDLEVTHFTKRLLSEHLVINPIMLCNFKGLYGKDKIRKKNHLILAYFVEKK